MEERDNLGSLTVQYVYGNDLISQDRAGIASYYHYDGLGSTRALSDSAEVVTDTYTYEAFGNITHQTGTTLNNYLFTGEQYDPNAGFYYLRARYYNLGVGRFVTRDPFEGKPFEPKSLHKYMYAGMNPVILVDPTGHSMISIAEASLVTGAVVGALFCGQSISHFGILAYDYMVNKKAPVKWKGHLVTHTFGYYIGEGTIGVSLESECIKRRDGRTVKSVKGKGYYLLSLIGVSVGPLIVNTSASSAEAFTPGLFGTDPSSLKGLSTFFAGTFSPTLGLGVSYINMGLGRLESGAIVVGFDVGVDTMIGYSYMVRSISKQDIPCSGL